MASMTVYLDNYSEGPLGYWQMTSSIVVIRVSARDWLRMARSFAGWNDKVTAVCQFGGYTRNGVTNRSSVWGQTK